LNGIATLVLVRHGLANEGGWAIWKGWRMSLEPDDMALGLVGLGVSVAILVFLAEPPSEFSQPPIVGLTLAHPDGTRVVRMCLLIRSLGKVCRPKDVVGAVQQLCSFKDHLHDVFVAVKASRSARATREDEDIHGGGQSAFLALNESVLETMEGGEDTEGQRKRILRMTQHRHESIGPLEDELGGGNRPRGNETPMNQGRGIAIPGQSRSDIIP
jgi:hypothetical protein